MMIRHPKNPYNVVLKAHSKISSSHSENALEKELEGYGVKARGYKSDASSKEAAEQLIADVLNHFETVSNLFVCFWRLVHLTLYLFKKIL